MESSINYVTAVVNGHYMNPYNDAKEEMTMYGFMPVKNASRFDPRHHCALVTTYSNGINMIEQGLIRSGQKIALHLKQFMRRRFGNVHIEGYSVDELERKIRVSGDYLEMEVQAMLTHDAGSIVTDDYTAYYSKIRMPIY